MPGSFEPAPETPHLTPPGFTAMLREAGALPQGAVTSLEISQRLQTTVSQLCFATVTYSQQVRELPNKVLVKWPLEGTAAPDRGRPELTFYKELAPALGSPPIARCVAAAPASTGHQWLVLEDLRSTHTNPPWPQPPSRSEAEGAVSALAHVHARWWEAPTLGSSVGVLHTHASLREMVQGIAGQLPGFLEALGDTPRSGASLPYLIDWQLWHLDVGARDLAFMIALHWDPTLRQPLERPLLHLYQRRLADGGVTGYSFDDLWLDYRRCVVRNLTFPIILWRRGLPPEAWRRRLDCALAAYRDLDGDDVL